MGMHISPIHNNVIPAAFCPSGKTGLTLLCHIIHTDLILIERIQSSIFRWRTVRHHHIAATGKSHFSAQRMNRSKGSGRRKQRIRKHQSKDSKTTKGHGKGPIPLIPERRTLMYKIRADSNHIRSGWKGTSSPDEAFGNALLSLSHVAEDSDPLRHHNTSGRTAAPSLPGKG